MLNRILWTCLGLLALATGPDAARAGGEDSTAGIEIGSHVFGDLRAREIGPAVMSGRIAALDAVHGGGKTILVGAASGGVWRSRNGGVTFKPVFDEHNQSIGAITIDQARPDTVWVGTGEVWVRNSVSVGDGVYRTTDGGDTWTRMGLQDSERIAEIVIHPTDPATVYVAVLGHLWNANDQRGLYRTTDSGATWERILFVDGNTGCSDIAMDPRDPAVLYAAMWDFRRLPYTFRSGGPGSGLYKSSDGGATWTELRDGMPEGELGRIAIAVSPVDPDRIYAAVESAESAFYRSDDAGAAWEKVNTQEGVKGRPFYFHLLIADPRDPDRCYKTSQPLLVTRDGGKTFGGLGGWMHVDQHALWIDPDDPTHMIAGNDGGVYTTYNRGDGWQHAANLPVSQFYRVAVDDRRPFRIYGGLQDNGSWYAPSRSPSGIENGDWENLGGGDGFAVAIDRTDQDLVYWEWQGGNLNRMDLRTGESKDVKPLPGAGEPEFRWNWNTPVVTTGGKRARLFTGSQFLHVSRDRGESWERLSGDLTTDDPQKLRQEESGGLTIDNTTAENHCTIFTIGPSPLDPDVIWVGTDDGNLQLTTDGGRRFTELSGRLPGLPPATWISCVEPSRFDDEVAFVTCDGHRNGDMATYVYATGDGGETWEDLTAGDITGYAHVIRQDPVNPDLLFLGTEHGLYVTLDRGRHWARFEEEFPPVPVNDLVFQERTGSLVIGTHGRGVWVLDDLAPLRQITAPVLEAEVAILVSSPAVLSTPVWKSFSPGDGYYVAGNPDRSARMVYYLKKRHMFGEMKLEIFTPEGELLKVLPGSKRKGLNIVSWSPRLKPPKVAPSPALDPATSYAGAVGPAAPEGVYTYRLTKGKEVHEGTVAVTYDEDYPHSRADRAEQQHLVQELYGMLARLAYVADAVTSVRDTVLARADDPAAGEALAADLRALADELDVLHGDLVVTEEVQGISGQRRLRENVVRLYAAVSGFGGRPTQSQVDRLEVFRTEIEGADRRFGELAGARLDGLNARLTAAGLAPVRVLTEEEFRNRE
ncbi:MAG: WD40/YVTN/BNR-like repeat-containing protein [Candidatus Krumholzibacteriia bacterium]